MIDYIVRSWSELPVLMDAVLVARLFGCGEYTVRQMARNGELPCFRIGRDLRFDKNEIKEYLKRKRIK
ncbi:MAG: helix-turn-helix domain-containing protein [Clostridia bacterium]|nr:helix-turn-helix domain-containing protein [Clostridia bacterium]